MPADLGQVQYSDIRFDPFSTADQGLDVGNRGPLYSGGNYYSPELHIVSDLDNYGRYGIQLAGIAKYQSTALFYNDSGEEFGVELERVNGTPGPGQYRVVTPTDPARYNLGFGFAETHHTDAGKEIEAHYKFLGTAVTVSLFEDLQNEIDAIALLNEVIIIKDEKSTGTNGGPFTSGSPQTRDLNTEYDPNSVSWYGGLASNEITLSESGIYLIDAIVPAYTVRRHQAWIYNVTAAATETGLLGTSIYASDSGDVQNHSHIYGFLQISASTAIRIHHQCEQTAATFGFGVASNSGNTEVYTQIKVAKLQ